MLSDTQLELFSDSPFTLRLPIPEALRIFCAEYWNALPSAEKTRQHIERLSVFFKSLHLDTVTKSHIADMRDTFKRLGLSEPTINRAHMIMSRLFTKFEEWKERGKVGTMDFTRLVLPSKNPAAQVRKTSESSYARRTVVSPAEFERLKANGDEAFKEILNMLVWTRLRPGDLRRVTSENINWNLYQLEGIQHKTITGRCPSGVPYRIPLTFEMEKILRRRLAIYPNSALFPMTNMQKKWEVARRAAELPNVQLRDLRRSAASSLLDNGIDLKTVSEGLGHTTPRVTIVYTPRNIKHLREATKKVVEIYKP